MKACCLRRLNRLGKVAQWPLLLTALIILLFYLPSFMKEPLTRPFRFRDRADTNNRSAGFPQEVPTTGKRTNAHHGSAPEEMVQDQPSKATAPPAEQNKTEKAGEGSPGRQDTASPTPRTLGGEKSTLSTPHGGKRVTTTKTPTPTHQNKVLSTSAGPKGAVPSLRSSREGTSTAAVQKVSPTQRVGSRTPTSKPKVKLKDPAPKEGARLQSPTSQRPPELKAANFKSEPRWDFEDKYSLEVGGLQTTCPDSVKVKAFLSPWLQHLFIANLTLFLDSGCFTPSEWARLEHFPPPFGFMELNYSLVQKVVAHFPPVPQQQLLLASHPAGEARCISCAVVGNGGILNNSRVGSEIDSHDYVFRLSGAIIKGYENDVGTRTSFYGFTAFSLVQSLYLLGRLGFQHVPLGKDVRYLHFLEGTRDFEWLEALLLNQTMKGNNFHWFRHRPQEAFREALHLDRYLLLHPDLLRYMKNRFLRSKTLDTTHWRIYRPTTGALLLLTALQLCDRVSAYGFITQGHERFSDHYYDKSWKRLIFYLNHDFNLEKALWKKLHDEGIIRLYQRPEPPK